MNKITHRLQSISTSLMNGDNAETSKSDLKNNLNKRQSMYLKKSSIWNCLRIKNMFTCY